MPTKVEQRILEAGRSLSRLNQQIQTIIDGDSTNAISVREQYNGLVRRLGRLSSSVSGTMSDDIAKQTARLEKTRTLVEQFATYFDEHEQVEVTRRENTAYKADLDRLRQNLRLMSVVQAEPIVNDIQDLADVDQDELVKTYLSLAAEVAKKKVQLQLGLFQDDEQQQAQRARLVKKAERVRANLAALYSERAKGADVDSDIHAATQQQFALTNALRALEQQ